MRVLIVIAAAGALWACAAAPTIEHITVDDSSALIRQGIRELSSQEAAGSRMLQGISARSCKQMAWDPDATELDAVAQLKIKAARLGANAVTNVACEPLKAATLSPNCWQSVVCRADAVVAR